MPVSAPSSSRTGRTVRLCRSVRRAISSASSSMETPALMRRTFAWLSTKRLKGMSRDWLRVIFCFDFDISDSPRRATESPSLDLLTRHEAGAALFLLRAAPENRRAEKHEGWKSEAREKRIAARLASGHPVQ